MLSQHEDNPPTGQPLSSDPEAPNWPVFADGHGLARARENRIHLNHLLIGYESVSRVSTREKSHAVRAFLQIPHRIRPLRGVEFETQSSFPSP